MRCLKAASLLRTSLAKPREAGAVGVALEEGWMGATEGTMFDVAGDFANSAIVGMISWYS